MTTYTVYAFQPREGILSVIQEKPPWLLFEIRLFLYIDETKYTKLNGELRSFQITNH